MLSSAASAEEECSDLVPPERGERAQAPFRRPESMISGPQEISSLDMCEEGLVKDPESRVETVKKEKEKM